VEERTDQGNPPAAVVPPVGEEVHLPGNTVIPLVMTLGVTLVLIGLTTFIGFTVVGALIVVWTLVRWIRDTRRDIDALPPEAH
jgi:Flp pilus assembly protein TadB